MKSIGVGKVKFFSTETPYLAALGGSGIDVMIAIENYKLPWYANSSQLADDFVTKFIVGFPNVTISSISVGNELFYEFWNTTIGDSLLPALKNIHKALVAHGLQDRVKLTSPMCCVISGSAYPPSTAFYRPDYFSRPGGIADYLKFLKDTGSYYTANIYPFFIKKYNPAVSRNFIFFQGNEGFYDNGLYYQNLLDAALDGEYNALERAGYPDLKVVISETGWASSGDTIASLDSLELYNSYIIGRVLKNQGPPKRPNFFQAYIFELFDSPLKGNNNSIYERYWGFYTDNGKRKTNISLTSGPVNPTKPAPRWCVAKNSSSDADLWGAISYACYTAGLDCSIINTVSPCITCPGCSAHDIMVRKANYAFNAFYQRVWQNNAYACDFGGNAKLSAIDPNPPGCSALKGFPGPKKWCVVKGDAASVTVQGGINYVCSQKKDCSFISPNTAPAGFPTLPGSCYNASNPALAASFAYNLWFQSSSQDPSSCAFNYPNGTATGKIVDVDPSVGACLYSGTSFPNYFGK